MSNNNGVLERNYQSFGGVVKDRSEGCRINFGILWWAKFMTSAHGSPTTRKIECGSTEVSKTVRSRSLRGEDERQDQGKQVRMGLII